MDYNLGGAVLAPHERDQEAVRMIICFLLVQAFVDEQIDEINIDLMHRSLSYALMELGRTGIDDPGFKYETQTRRYPDLEKVTTSLLKMKIANLASGGELELAPNAWGRTESLLRDGYRMDASEKSRYAPACRKAVRYYIGQVRFESCDE